jgi:hypothetical protein
VIWNYLFDATSKEYDSVIFFFVAKIAFAMMVNAIQLERDCYYPSSLALHECADSLAFSR